MQLFIDLVSSYFFIFWLFVVSFYLVQVLHHPLSFYVLWVPLVEHCGVVIVVLLAVAVDLRLDFSIYITYLQSYGNLTQRIVDYMNQTFLPDRQGLASRFGSMIRPYSTNAKSFVFFPQKPENRWVELKE